MDALSYLTKSCSNYKLCKIVNITGFLLFLIGFCSLIMIAQTLSYLNFSAPGPIVHGEVKLDNILFDEILSAKISDFGAPIGLFLQRYAFYFYFLIATLFLLAENLDTKYHCHT